MSPKKLPLWISREQAARLLTANTDHTISPDYLKILVRDNVIRYKAIDGRTNAYNRRDAESICIRPVKTPKRYALVTDTEGKTSRLMVYTTDGENGYVIREYRRIPVERLPARNTWKVVEAKQEQLI